MRLFPVVQCIVAGLLLLAPAARAQTGGGDEVVFMPPEEGAPGDRVGAGTRASLRKGILTLLAPPGGGQTAQGSPLLVWHVRDGFEGRMKLALQEKGAARPWLVVEEPVRWIKGMHGLSFADFGLTIEPGRILEWSLVLTPASADSPGTEARSFIERVSTGKGAATMGQPREAMRALAAEGLWYDALAKGVELSPAGEVRVIAQDEVASLLKSAGLP